MINKNQNIDKKEQLITEIYEQAYLSDYCNFNLHALAKKIKLKEYKPRTKMLYL